MDTPIQLKNVPLLQGLTPSELEEVRACLREKSFAKGEALFHESASCERVFIVKTGRVKVYRMSTSGREQVIETLEPGDTCACNPGSAAWTCSSSAEAVVPTTVWFLSRDSYVRIVNTRTNVSHALNRLFAEKLSKLSCLVEDVSLNDVRKRLVKFLLDLRADSRSDTLEVPFTRQEIAQRIGTARETVARHLYELKRKHLIDIKSRQIVLLNKPGLQKILSGE
ncbi:MAG: CRP-like cAMP-activated global transcriptional regulator [Candidatus Omnitrophica bacterium]|nr:CRP-like cAMP-activated global transcriptional regulator [Candidatus Omnitrophota bacterium]